MTQRNSVTFDEPAGEYPPRYWWLKRILAASAVVLIVLVVTQIWWSHIAQARLDRALARLRAAGEPSTLEDLDTSGLKDADNAAFYLKRAASKINPAVDSPSDSNYEWDDARFPYPAKWWAMEQAAAAADQAAFVDLREARKHPRANWMSPVPPLTQLSFAHLGPQRTLTIRATDYAMWLHFNGHDAEAMEMLFDAIHLADAIDQEPFIVSNLVAGGMRAKVSAQMLLIAPEVTVAGASPTTRPSDRPPSREQIQRMIALLLDDSFRTKAAAYGGASERVAQIELVMNMSQTQLVLRPMLVMDAAHIARSQNMLTKTAAIADWPAANAALNGRQGTPNPARIVGKSLTYSNDMAVETEFRIEMECTAAAVSLACRLYRLDHNGALPPKLDALVPTYLPNMPIDPLAGGNKPFGYVILDHGQRAVLYSVGPDGVDDTAAGVPIPNLPFYGWNSGTKDQYQDLLRWQPAPSSQPGSTTSSETADN
jgi:hypothetical protein